MTVIADAIEVLVVGLRRTMPPILASFFGARLTPLFIGHANGLRISPGCSRCAAAMPSRLQPAPSSRHWSKAGLQAAAIAQAGLHGLQRESGGHRQARRTSRSRCICRHATSSDIQFALAATAATLGFQNQTAPGRWSLRAWLRPSGHRETSEAKPNPLSLASRWIFRFANRRSQSEFCVPSPAFAKDRFHTSAHCRSSTSLDRFAAGQWALVFVALRHQQRRYRSGRAYPAL